MSEALDEETMKLIRLRRVTQQLQEKRDVLQRVWVNMQNFAQGLRNELDSNYWSESKIAFTDLANTPQFNQYKFNHSELKELFEIDFIKETLDAFRNLTEDKARLESELGISMGRPVARPA
ncbi:hypothetical protein DRO27_05345 [Candidatus Bathyarchaeota archaeon]|nr:MAG: hypothetical protein DRO27_05345 [Candidatus Bathyarchaeota archaeon]